MVRIIGMSSACSNHAGFEYLGTWSDNEEDPRPAKPIRRPRELKSKPTTVGQPVQFSVPPQVKK